MWFEWEWKWASVVPELGFSTPNSNLILKIRLTLNTFTKL